MQRLILQHARHHLTQLVKAKVQVSDLDMTQHLGLHDTLEGTFANHAFWERSTAPARRGFRHWVLSAIQVFGMVRGKRYVLFQSDADKDSYLLFGMGVTETEEGADAPFELVPYIKPFTRKSGYLLEIRSRAVGDSQEYHRELRHYVLPYLFAFDAIRNFQISEELLTFFKSDY